MDLHHDTRMSLIGLILVLILVGVGLYLVNSVIPMDSKIKTILNVVVVVIVILWLIDVFGFFDMHVGRTHLR